MVESALKKMLPTRSLLVIDLNDAVGTAIKKLRGNESSRYAVIRRKEGRVTYWYVFLREFFEQEYIGRRFGSLPARLKRQKTTLRELLGGIIHEYLSSDTVSPEEEAPAYDPKYEHGAWPGGQLPVGIVKGKPAVVFEPVELHHAARPPRMERERVGVSKAAVEVSSAAAEGSVSAGAEAPVTAAEAAEGLVAPEFEPSAAAARLAEELLAERLEVPGAAAEPAIAEFESATVPLEKMDELMGAAVEREVPRMAEVATPVPVAPITVYPSIEPEKENLVQKVVFDVAVHLEKEKDEKTFGVIHLPSAAPEAIYELDVHLLLAKESHWRKLKFSQELGTIKAAKFRIPAPEIAPTLDGTIPEHEIAKISANFYLNHRWCGEAVRNIRVLASADVKPPGDVPPPDVPEWRKMLHMAADAQPPDLLVRIEKVSSETFEWSFQSPHMNFVSEPEKSRIEVRGGAANFVRTLFEPLSGLKLEEIDLLQVKGIGEAIYRKTPEAFKEAYWQLFPVAQSEGFAFETILFISDEPFIPWELMVPADDERAKDVAGEILSIRHATGRWIASGSCQLRQSITVEDFAVIATDYEKVDAVKKKLPGAAEERKHLKDAFQACEVPVRIRDVINFLENGKAEAIHFAGHGQMNVDRPELSVLLLEDDQKKFQTTLVNRQEVRKNIGQYHPFVFLNACQVGQPGEWLSLVTGWPHTFLDIGAAAVVAPLWSIDDTVAKTISMDFYDRIRQPGARLGKTLQDIRREWEEQSNLTFLAYVLYGDPLARVTLPAAVPCAPNP